MPHSHPLRNLVQNAPQFRSTLSVHSATRGSPGTSPRRLELGSASAAYTIDGACVFEAQIYPETALAGSQ